MRRRLDVLDSPARRKIFWSYVHPVLPVVSSHIKRSVVRPSPNHTFFQRRLGDRIKSAVELFASNIASDRLAAHSLTTIRFSRQIGGDPFPGHSLVASAMNIL